MTDTTSRFEYTVTSMSCNSCRSLVLEELEELDGVTDVSVDLASGHVVVDGSNLSDEMIRSTLAAVGHAPQ